MVGTALPSFKKKAASSLSAATVGHSVNSHLEDVTHRMAALSMASSQEEVINCLPHPYRGALKPSLLALVGLMTKQASVQSTLSKLRHHKATGSWPQQLLGLHQPCFQLSKEFDATQPLLKGQMSEQFNQFRASQLDSAILLKEAELEWLVGQLLVDRYLPSMMDTVKEVYDKVMVDHKQPILAEGPEPGQIQISGWEVNPLFLTEYKRMLENLSPVCARLLEIEREKLRNQAHKLEEKVRLKEQADVEMGDAPSSAKAVSVTVQAEITKALKNLGLDKKKKVSPALSSSCHSNLTWSKGKSSTIHTQERPKEEAKEFTLSPEEAANASREKAYSKRERQAEVILADSDWRYDAPSTYPDMILLIPRPLAISLLLSRLPLARLEAAKYRSRVHLGPGVTLPDHLAIHVSPGLRYMFYQYCNPRYVWNAWNNFCNTLRWKIFFLSDPNHVQMPYDPDYDLHKEPSLAGPSLAYIEDGLRAGESYISKYMEREIPLIKQYHTDSGLVTVAHLEEYCKKNELIISPTDKNLGACVVTRDWFIRQCKVLLEDRQNYTPISLSQQKEMLQSLTQKIKRLSTLPWVEHNNPQLAEFMRSKIPPDSDQDIVLPTFYGIPKIHKKPWKMRPIVPCHSAIQNPVAKFVSKTLKPFLEARPYVLKGSKDLAKKLADLTIPQGKKIYLVSGDIVAFYPNIPRSKAITIASNGWRAFKRDASLEEIDFVWKSIILANGDLMFKFQDQTYLQKKGLAMGVSCSPDIANLFGAYYEEKFFNEPHPEWLFFARFIDDCIAVIAASSPEEALLHTSHLKYEGVELVWSVSEWSTPFLDLLVYIDPFSNKVEHMPYRKALNHKERIPWASHHPKHVKKGTFLGEMSRLATLSSKQKHYLTAIEELASLYIGRGYPMALVRNWIKDNSAKRWANRLGEPTERNPSIFVLKSSFNPAWDRFNVHELATCIKEAWLKSISDTAWCNHLDCSRPGHSWRGSRSPSPEIGRASCRERV